MAKRRRLSPVDPEKATLIQPKTAPSVLARAPIAEVVSDSARAASFDAVAGELAAARSEGRLVLSLPLEAIDAGYLIRDRMTLDPEDLAALTDSIRARGQQTPIEVVDRGARDHRRQYGLISGLRRLRVLQALAAEDPDRFGQVKALVRQPEGAAEAYLAMVEENEIRAGLSFYEKAHLALSAAEAGIYPDTEAALKALFAAVPKAKRSKIRSFVTLVEALRGHPRFPAEIPEHLGLRLVKAIREEPAFGPALSNRLASRPATTAAEERRLLEASLTDAGGQSGKDRADTPPAIDREVAPGIRVTSPRGTDDVRLSGPGVTAELVAALQAWISAETGSEPAD